MVALFLRLKGLVDTVASRFRAEYERLLRAVDTFMESGMRHAMPQRRLGRRT